jgi:hypothetical protein
MAIVDAKNQSSDSAVNRIILPAPTPWPFVLAFSIALIFGGLVTSVSVIILGAVLTVAAFVGWFRDLFPHEKEETVEVTPGVVSISTNRPVVERLQAAPELTRALLPLKIYPKSAGIKGALAGSVAMAILACLYGLLKQGSIWYPINLLAASVYAQSQHFETRSLNAFYIDSFLIASSIHLFTSLLVGVLYGVLLPMIPRRPILLGGIIAPILWTGLLYNVLGFINPLLNKLIAWPWFVASQLAFGIVAGLVVVKHGQIRTRQFEPFLIRAGIEAPGIMNEKSGEEK